MNLFSIIAVFVFILGYFAITLEERLSISKSAIALAMGGVLWVVFVLSNPTREFLEESMHASSAEIFQIIVFLLAAMTLVEILVHYRFFDLIRTKIAKLNLRDKKQFIAISILTFFLSAVLDNLTITIVMIQIARQFFKGKNLTVVAAGIVLMANAGGAWSPIGDVTTIMIWLAHKFTVLEIISNGFLPSSVLALVSGFFILRQIENNKQDVAEDRVARLTRGEKIIITSSLLTFSLPLFMNMFGLPPFIGLLLGLSVVWIMIEFIKSFSRVQTHLDANIDRLLQKTDITSLNFFIGILLAVGALKAIGILETLSLVAFGADQEFLRVAVGTVIMGLFSAVVDNIPLTALAINIITIPDPNIWVLLALSVGTGGSVLVIGSVAGVIAMGMVKELTFGRYFRIAAMPALIGYSCAIAAWSLQTLLIH